MSVLDGEGGGGLVGVGGALKNKITPTRPCEWGIELKIG